MRLSDWVKKERFKYIAHKKTYIGENQCDLVEVFPFIYRTKSMIHER